MISTEAWDRTESNATVKAKTAATPSTDACTANRGRSWTTKNSDAGWSPNRPSRLILIRTSRDHSIPSYRNKIT